jgi:hypothetical protein
MVIIITPLTPHAFWNITDFGAKCENLNLNLNQILEKTYQIQVMETTSLKAVKWVIL